MSNDADDQEAPKKKGKLIPILGFLVAVAAGGGGAWYFMKGEPKEGESQVENKFDDLESARKRQSGEPPQFVTVETFTFNLSDRDRDRFAQVGVTFEVADPSVEAELKAMEPAVRNAPLVLMTSKTSQDLLSVPGKQKLAVQMVNTTNAILAGEPPPRIEISRQDNKKKKASLIIRGERPGDNQDSRDAHGDSYAQEGDDYRRYSRRARKIPDRIYATHFSKFLIQ